MLNLEAMNIDLPYYIEHALISIGISLVAFLLFGYGALTAGFIFYLGREIRDWEKLHNWDIKGFDWKGLLYPLVATIILMIIS